MPKFNKNVEELETRFEKWIYVLKNLKRLDKLPDKLRERIFEKICSIAEIARLSQEEYQQYIVSLNAYRDIKNSLDTARGEAKAEGKMEEKLEIAKNVKEIIGLTTDQIQKITGLTAEEINKL